MRAAALLSEMTEHSRVGACIACVVEDGTPAPDDVTIANIFDIVEDIKLIPHPTGQDADGRMLFLAPDANKALHLVRCQFQAAGGARFTFTLA